jgi:hypothetical protein
MGRSNGFDGVPDTGSPRRRLTREEVLRGLDESLQQLRRNFVDLYLVHEPDQFELTDEVKELFAALQADGTVGAFGLAWGRPAETGIGFGTVVQGRYAVNLPAHGSEGETRIIHGVLRYRPYESGAHYENAGIRIRKVLDAHPDAGVIFSASTPFQIRCALQDLG